MTRKDRTAPRAGASTVPIVAFVALFGLTLVVFFLQFDRSPAPPAGGAPGPGGGVGTEAPHPQSMPLNASFQQRLDDLQAALEANPGDTAALAELSGIWLTAHQPERGLALSQQWTEVAPESVEAWLQLVAAYGLLQRWDEALEANRRVLELSPDNRTAMVNMGALHANRQELEEARRWWTRVVEEAPGTSEADLAARSLRELEGSGPR